jgi:uncharacterized protein (DUF433 family)
MATKLTTTRVQPGHYVYPHITKIPEVCGGKATIDGRRVRVMDIVSLHQDGCTPEKILEEYDFLGFAQIHAAMAYYYDGNQQEIESAFEADRRWEESVARESRGGEPDSSSSECQFVKVIYVKRDRE